MFINNIFKTCIGVLISLLIVVATVSCNKEDFYNCNTEFISDCEISKFNGIDKSYSFMEDTTWLNYTSYEEKLQACQIPNSILNTMCTYNLVKTCLEHYPFIIDIIAFNSMQDGFNRYNDGFNGIQELIKRCDGCIELIDYYKKLSIMIHPDSVFTFRGSWGVIITETFLAQTDFFSALSKNERIELLELAKDVKLIKLNDNRHGEAVILSTNWIISRIMVFEDYQPFINEVETNPNLKHFIETMNAIDGQSYKEIDTLILKYSNDFSKL